jgi:hypothetical protein
LFIEIEVARTLIDRILVLAALRVPEVCRCNGRTLEIGLLQGNGVYAWGDKSPTFQEVPASSFIPFLQRAGRDEMHFAIAQSFRSWLRGHLKKEPVS